MRILGTTCSAAAVFPALALLARLVGRSGPLTNRKPDSSCQWLSCCDSSMRDCLIFPGVCIFCSKSFDLVDMRRYAQMYIDID